jgi:hypothetical protein
VCYRSVLPTVNLVHHLCGVSKNNDEDCVSRTLDGLVSSTLSVACAVVDRPFLSGDLVSTPAVLSIRHGHDVLVFLQADELTVAGGSVQIVAVVLKRGSCRKASDGCHLTGSLDDGGCGDVVFNGRGWCWCIISSDGQQHRSRCEGGNERDVDHGCGDGGLVGAGTRCREVPVLYTSRCGLWGVSRVRIRSHCESISHLRPRRKRVHSCKARNAVTRWRRRAPVVC